MLAPTPSSLQVHLAKGPHFGAAAVPAFTQLCVSAAQTHASTPLPSPGNGLMSALRSLLCKVQLKPTAENCSWHPPGGNNRGRVAKQEPAPSHISQLLIQNA